jgi:hypothetical protein
MEGIKTQITAAEQRIAASTGNIEQWTAEVQELIKQNAPKSQKMLLVKKVSATRKARSILQGQLAQLEDALLSAQSGEVAVEGRATQQLVDACAQLARNASKDPAVNPYFYSRNEAKPEHAAVAHKRASMRARGKNPGPWTSSLDAHNMRSAEQEEGADSILIGVEAERVAAAHGQKKKKRGKKGNRSKMKKSKKSKSKSRRRR